MLKKILLFVGILVAMSAAVLTIFLMTQPKTEQLFSDSKGIKSGKYLKALEIKGVLTPLQLTGGKLEPKEIVTKGQLSMMLMRLNGFTSAAAPVEAPADPEYEDLSDYDKVYARGIYSLPSIKESYENNFCSSWNTPVNNTEADKLANQLLGVETGVKLSSEALTRDAVLEYLGKINEGDKLLPKQVFVYAGNANSGQENDQRLKASFRSPTGICFDNSGGMIVCDTASNLLRRISDDIVTTYIGKTDTLDNYGYPRGGYKDGVEPLDARLNQPGFIVSHSDGIYFTESKNSTLRKLNFTDGIIYTYSGNGKQAYSNGKNEDTSFNHPSGVAISDDGIIYIADTLNHCIRKIEKGISSVAAGIPEKAGYKNGNGKDALFCEPTAIFLDKTGELYICDTGNNIIRKMNNKGVVSTVAGGKTVRNEDSGYMTGGYLDGKAGKALFKSPGGIFVTEDGRILVSDTENHCIRMILDEEVTTVAGNGRAYNTTGNLLESSFNRPTGITYRDHTVFIADTNNNVIKAFPLD